MSNKKYTYESVLDSEEFAIKGRKVIILRGEPGVGKSTLAAKIKKQKPGAVATVEADTYYNRPDGYYDFNWNLLSRAHDWCFDQFAQLITNWMPMIIVSNTATRLKEYKRYVEMAEANEYKVIIATLKRNFGNVHGVAQDKVDLMRNRIEEYPNEIIIE